MVSVRRLLLLEDVARLGSFSAVAAEQFLTTSAVSQQIQKLESEAGQPLVERVAHGVKLTEAGHALVRHALAIRHQLAAAEADLASFTTMQKGRVTLGSFPSASATLLPAVLALFTERYPRTKISVVSSLRPDLVERMLRRELDLSLLWEYPWNRLDPAELTSEHLLQDPTVYLISAQNKFAERRFVRLRDLKDQEWIVRGGGHPAGELLRRATLEAGFEPRITFESHDYQETQAMVAAGLGIAMMPRLGLAVSRPDVRIVQADPRDRLPSRTMYVSKTSRHRTTPATSKLYELIFQALRPVADWLSAPEADIRGPIPEV